MGAITIMSNHTFKKDSDGSILIFNGSEWVPFDERVEFEIARDKVTEEVVKNKPPGREGIDYIVEPNTGRYLHPKTLQPYDTYIDFTDIEIMK